jgi:hypothetical protein
MPSGPSIGAPGAVKELAPLPSRLIATMWPFPASSVGRKRRLVTVSYAMPSGSVTTSLPRFNNLPPLPSMLAAATVPEP